MRVPVLVLLPAQEPLRESAFAASEHRRSGIPLESADIPGRIELDTSYSAVPVGTGRRSDTVATSMTPGASDQFAVRGYVEAASQQDVPEVVEGRPVFADPAIQPFVTCGSDPPVGDAALVRQKLGVAALAAKGLDGTDVAVAIMDTGINLAHLTAMLGTPPRFDVANSWTTPALTTPPGKHPVDHGTMCAYDVLIAGPAATLLDYPILGSRAPGGSAASGTISTALLAFSSLLANWGVAFAAGGLSRYRGLVVNNSWGVYHPSWDFPSGHAGRYIDNPRHPFNLIVGVLAGTGADILFAAGNCGAQCADPRCQGLTSGTIIGANAHPDVLTIAGCDTNDVRVGYSAQGPSIAGMHAQKPDLATYTHFLGSEAFGAGTPDSGTSAACPVAAGCIAALRTRLASGTHPPSQLFAQLRAVAPTAPGQIGWNGDYGHGFLDPVTAAGTLGL